MKKINFIYFGLFIVASAAFLLFTKPGNQVIGSVIFSMTDMQQNIQKEEQNKIAAIEDKLVIEKILAHLDSKVSCTQPAPLLKVRASPPAGLFT